MNKLIHKSVLILFLVKGLNVYGQSELPAPAKPDKKVPPIVTGSSMPLLINLSPPINKIPQIEGSVKKDTGSVGKLVLPNTLINKDTLYLKLKKVYGISSK